MTPTSKIEVVDYDDQWPDQFQALRAVYQRHVGHLVEGIEHVGSTSVPGLAAKPILDIDLIIRSWTVLPPIIDQLSQLGYEHQGNLGIKDREAFRRNDAQVPYDGSGQSWPAHHLYVCLAGGEGLTNHLTLRNFLRSHPDKAQEYAALKHELAARHPYDIEAYVAGKTDFIQAIIFK